MHLRRLGRGLGVMHGVYAGSGKTIRAHVSPQLAFEQLLIRVQEG